MLYTINNLIEYYEKFNNEKLKNQNEKLIEKNIEYLHHRDIYSIKDENWLLYNKIIIQLNHNMTAISIIMNRRGL